MLAPAVDQKLHMVGEIGNDHHPDVNISTRQLQLNMLLYFDACKPKSSPRHLGIVETTKEFSRLYSEPDFKVVAFVDTRGTLEKLGNISWSCERWLDVVLGSVNFTCYRTS